jgi:surface antigen
MSTQHKASGLGWFVALIGIVSVFALLATVPKAQAAHGRATAHARKHHKPRRVVVRIKHGGRGGDPGDDYPAVWRNAAQDSELDNWGEFNRECTSFAAWALASRNGFNMPFHANAINWGPDAETRGYAVNQTPAVGSIAWSNKPPFGHVAYVEAVQGSNVYIEEYNEHENGEYDSRTVPASTFTGYIHFKDIATPSGPANPPIQGGNQPPIQGTPTPPIQGTNPIIQGNPNGGSGGGSSTVYQETTGGVTHTWTNYTDAGGTEGPSIPANATVQIACKVQGFAVADGNTWWYRIQSSPWSGTFYSSADAFYNESGVTSGSLHNTPYVDGGVPNC